MKKILFVLLAVGVAFSHIVCAIPSLSETNNEISEDYIFDAVDEGYVFGVGEEFVESDDAFLLSDPPLVTESEALAKIDDLVAKLDGKNFTVSGEPCTSECNGDSLCDDGKNSNIVSNSQWFIEMFGNLDVSNFPSTYKATTGQYSGTGWSCYGFGTFAQWYIFASKPEDKIVDKKVLQNVEWNYKNIKRYCKPGDNLRLGSSSKADQHTVIFISCNSSRVTVLEANYDGKNGIRKGTYSYTKWVNFSISRATNYDVPDYTPSAEDYEYQYSDTQTKKEYRSYKFKCNWQEAQAFCESYGGHLVTITNTDEQAIAEKLATDTDIACWIGAYRPDSSTKTFQWVTDEPFDYTNWDSDEPSYKSGSKHELYVGIYGNDTDSNYATTGMWNDFSATTSTVTGFICEWDAYEIVYDANGGENPPQSQWKNFFESIKLSSEKPVRYGFIFKGWATAHNETTVQYRVGSTYSSNENVTLYAVWEPIYTKTIVVEKDSGVTCIVQLNGIPESTRLWFAVYYGGKFIRAESREVTSLYEVFTVTETADTVKVFVFDDSELIKPIAVCETVNLI